MTFVASATQQDRQDFVGTEALNAAPLYVNAGPNIAHGETTGLFDVRRWPYLQLRMFNSTAVRTMWVQVAWYDDTALTTILDQVNFTTLSSGRIVDSVPNVGPYCSVTVFWDDNNAHQGSGVIMGRASPGISGTGDAVGGGTTQVPVQQVYQVWGAGANVLLNASFVQRGRAVLCVEAGGAGLQVLVRQLDVAGGFGPMIAGVVTAAGAGLAQSVPFNAGTHQLQLQVANNTGGPINASAVVMLGPLL